MLTRVARKAVAQGINIAKEDLLDKGMRRSDPFQMPGKLEMRSTCCERASTVPVCSC
jgi:hypothetical protein